MTTEETIAALDRGEIRVAEKRGDAWVVNEEAKQAILDYFGLRKMEPIEVGPFEYHDKIPLKHGWVAAGARGVPPRSVVVPGTRPKDFPAGTFQLSCALIVGRRSASTDEKVSLNDALREYGIGSG